MHPKKIANLLALPAADRYAYFVRMAADFEQVWGLEYEAGGWAMAADDHGATAIPFWPGQELAELCRKDQWASCSARSISLEALLERWLPGIAKDGLLVAVFPPPEGKGALVEPLTLRDELASEAAEYE